MWCLCRAYSQTWLKLALLLLDFIQLTAVNSTREDSVSGNRNVGWSYIYTWRHRDKYVHQDLPLTYTNPLNMTLISNDPSWWPQIEYDLGYSYYIVAASVAVIYDWVLMFGQELELIWKQRLSLMTVMYLSLRYGGIMYSVINVPARVLTLSVTDAGCTFFAFQQWWTFMIANIILAVIVINRLHAMYQRSRKMLIFLVVVFLAVTISIGVITAIQSSHLTGEEFVLSGTYQCITKGDNLLLVAVSWILGTAWEVLTLCLAIWIAVKHFRERISTGSIIEDCFMVLIKSHIVYFASFACVACFYIGRLSQTLSNSLSVGVVIYRGFLIISADIQMFVLGPRLILSIREYNAKVVADSEKATGVSTIAFQESASISTGSSV